MKGSNEPVIVYLIDCWKNKLILVFEKENSRKN